MLGYLQLMPEINNQADLTFKWTAEKTILNIDLFGSYLQDYISSGIDTSLSPRLPTSPGVRQYLNIDKAYKTGFEINWTQDLVIGLHQQMGIAYTYAQDLERDEPLPEIAPLDFRYMLRGNYWKGKLQPEATFRYVIRQNRISNEFGETETPAFSLLDLNLTYELSKNFRFKVGIINLLDQAYYEHLNRAVRGTVNPILAPGRNIFASANIRFN